MLLSHTPNEIQERRALTVNPAKGKKLTNIRASGSDENVKIPPHHVM